VIAEAQLRGGKAASGRPPATSSRPSPPPAGAGPTARSCCAATRRLCTKKVITTCLEQGVEFSPSVTRNRAITTAIEAIDEAAYAPVHYPGAVADPDTEALISDAEVAETPSRCGWAAAAC
jgi:hypothetical protein